MKNIARNDVKEILNNPNFFNNGILDLSSMKELQEIKAYAFANSKKAIKKVIFNDALEIIEMAAFMFNEIEEIVWGKNIQTIDNSAFENNKITKLVLPKSINKINEAAFANNLISSLFIDENIQEIEIDAFANNSIEKLEINNLNVKIDNLAFDKNENIKNIILKSDFNFLIGKQNLDFFEININFFSDFHLYELDFSLEIDNILIKQVLNSLIWENIQEIKIINRKNLNSKVFKFSNSNIEMKNNSIIFNLTTNEEKLLNVEAQII